VSFSLLVNLLFPPEIVVLENNRRIKQIWEKCEERGKIRRHTCGENGASIFLDEYFSTDFLEKMPAKCGELCNFQAFPACMLKK
jgi:hypothetical protein